jgi:hypothetical protein
LKPRPAVDTLQLVVVVIPETVVSARPFFRCLEFKTYGTSGLRFLRTRMVLAKTVVVSLCIIPDDRDEDLGVLNPKFGFFGICEM